MALKKTVKTDFGIVVDGAYHRVTDINIFEKTRMIFNVSASVDKTLPAFSNVAYECEFLLVGENPISQAYAHLKSLPEFSDAVDF